MDRPSKANDSNTSTHDFLGSWWLQSREDRSLDGSPRPEPTLGADALGILTYANGKFSAQFMKRDRTEVINILNDQGGLNNTGAVDGYDAFFGSYSVNKTTGEVLHRLEGALSADNVGMEVTRRLEVIGNELTIQVETTAMNGEPVVRTLTWKRIS